ncbi:MAG: hypothetical protein IBX55_00790 [Methyloprofundus sp.]|nr:hypothetical protein [Methyloprofundus sp.]
MKVNTKTSLLELSMGFASAIYASNNLVDEGVRSAETKVSDFLLNYVNNEKLLSQNDMTVFKIGETDRWLRNPALYRFMSYLNGIEILMYKLTEDGIPGGYWQEETASLLINHCSLSSPEIVTQGLLKSLEAQIGSENVSKLKFITVYDSKDTGISSEDSLRELTGLASEDVLIDWVRLEESMAEALQETLSLNDFLDNNKVSDKEALFLKNILSKDSIGIQNWNEVSLIMGNVDTIDYTVFIGTESPIEDGVDERLAGIEGSLKSLGLNYQVIRNSVQKNISISFTLGFEDLMDYGEDNVGHPYEVLRKTHYLIGEGDSFECQTSPSIRLSEDEDLKQISPEKPKLIQIQKLESDIEEKVANKVSDLLGCYFHDKRNFYWQGSKLVIASNNLLDGCKLSNDKSEVALDANLKANFLDLKALLSDCLLNMKSPFELSDIIEDFQGTLDEISELKEEARKSVKSIDKEQLALEIEDRVKALIRNEREPYFKDVNLFEIDNGCVRLYGDLKDGFAIDTNEAEHIKSYKADILTVNSKEKEVTYGEPG